MFFAAKSGLMIPLHKQNPLSLSGFHFHNLTPQEFQQSALEVFAVQYQEVAVYRKFCEGLGVQPGRVKSIFELPFLPIEAFKKHSVIRNRQQAEIVFESSGTTGQQTSKHLVSDVEQYRKSFRTAFEHFYGNICDYTVLALLPSYLERSHSSLVFMVSDWIAQSQQSESGFYLYNHDALYQNLKTLIQQKRKVLLIGVTFALLDFAQNYRLPKNETIIMETGGMKGRGQEPVRAEVHQILQEKLGVKNIHSEYGMTELLSQAYSKNAGVFHTPPWMKVLIRDPEDPLSFLPEGKTGGINIIDLANLNSCSFLATQDLGRLCPDGGFEVLGRFDQADVRGCNLLIS